MESESVYTLLTELCQQISSPSLSLYVPTSSSQPELNQRVIKKLRAFSYEILLHKSTSIPTYKRERKRAKDGDFQYIRDPVLELRLQAMPAFEEPSTPQIERLQESIDSLDKFGMLKDPSVESVITLLLDLCCQVPESHDDNPGFFNSGQFHIPTYSMDGTVTPYVTYSEETFKPALLLKSLAGNLQQNKLVVPYEMPNSSLYDEPPDFDLRLSSLFKHSGSNSSLLTSKRSPSSTNTTSTKPSSCSLTNFSDCADVEYCILSEEDDIWDLADETPSNNLRMWESIKDLDPNKYKPHLTDVSQTSLVHNLLISEQVHQYSPVTNDAAPLKFHILENSKYIADLRYMLMGIQSTTFTFDEDRQIFVLDSNTCLPDISPEKLAVSSANLIDCGSYCRLLDALTNRPLTSNLGPIVKQLYDSVQRYLYFYKAVIININEKATILSISVRVQKLINQMRAMGRLCKVDSPEPLPAGNELLAYLYNEIMAVHNRDVASIFISVLHSCVSSYFRYLESWLFEGSCDSLHKEFFIEPNNDMLTNHSRLFWKHAFILHWKAVPGFMKGLEKPVFETGKALHLLQLCNPSDPLLTVLESGKPHLKFSLKSGALKQSQTEFESYYQRCIAVTGPPVTVDLCLEQSHEQENDLHKRVQEVYAARHAQYKASRTALAQREADSNQQKYLDWQEDCQRRVDFKEKQKQHLREEEEKWQREELQRDKDLAYLEAERCIIEEHKEVMSVLEQKKEYYESQLAAYEPNKALSTATADESQANARFLEDSSTTTKSWSNAKQSPNNNELPTPNGNTRIDIHSLLDNYSINQTTTENNWINIDPDVQNRNVESTVELISSANNNAVEVIPTNKLHPDFTISFASTGELKPRTELTLDLTRKLSAANIRKKMMSTDECLSHPWHVVDKQQPSTMAEEEYLHLAKGCSRKGSAERIRRRMTGFEHFTSPYNTAAIEVTTNAPKTAAGVAALENKRKVLQSEYGYSLTESSRNQSKVLSTCEEMHCQAVETESSVPQAAGGNTADTDMQKNRNRAVHGEFDILTGNRKVACLIPDSSLVSADKQPSSVESNKTSSFATTELASDVETPVGNISDKNQVEYKRNESILSVSSFGLTPLDCLPSNTSSVISAESTSTVNPFFNSDALNRLYPFATCDMYDKGWEQYLNNVPSDFYQKVLTPKVEDIEAVDLDNSDMVSINNLLKKTTIVALRIQMKLVNDAIVKYFLVDLDLLSHLQSLRNYFFLLDGEFGSTVTTGLFQALSRAEEPDTLLNSFTLNEILSLALSSSMNKDHKNATLLSFTVNDPPAHFKHSDPQVLSCVNMDYKVEWPLNIIITDVALQKYKQVFEFLLKLRRASWVLEEDFIMLKQLGKNRHFAKSGQYVHVTLMRQEMTVLIKALHYYMTSTVLQASWSEFSQNLQEKANTLDNIYIAHVRYMTTVLVRCLLIVTGKANNFHIHINNIFILVLKFHDKLNLASWTFDNVSKQFEHPNYKLLVRISKVFQEQARAFVLMSKQLATKKHYSHLIELMQKLSMNNYYEKYKFQR